MPMHLPQKPSRHRTPGEPRPRRGLSIRAAAMLLLLALVAMGAAACGPSPTPTPIVPTPTTAAENPSPPAPTATTIAPTAAPTSTAVPPTNTAAPTATQTPQPTPTREPMPAYTWKQVGLAKTYLRDLALLPGGTNAVYAAASDGLWRAPYDYTTWDKLPAPKAGNPPPGNAVVAAGSADLLYYALHTGCASGLPMTSYRSTDGGQTWTPMSIEINSVYAPNAGMAYATTCLGVLKTTDGGTTWSGVLPGSEGQGHDPYDVVSSPDGQQVYAAYVSEGGTGFLKRSTDGGATWTDITPKRPEGEELRAAMHLMFVPGSVGRPDDGGLYVSNDQATWFLPLETDDWTINPSGNTPGASQYYVTAFYVDTTYTEEYNKPGPVLYEARTQFGDEGPAGLGVFRSTDLGKSWQRVGDALGKKMVTALVLAPHDTAADPAMVETLLAATADGVWSVPMPPPFK